MNKIKLVESTPADRGFQGVAQDKEKALLSEKLIPYIEKAKKGQITDNDLNDLLRNSLIKRKYEDFDGEDNNEFIKSLATEFHEADDDEEVNDNPEESVTDLVPDMQDEPVTSLDDQSSDESPDFITSDELNEMREVLLDIPDDIMLLMLNDDVIVLGTEEDNKTKLYTLSDGQEDLGLIEMPMELSTILSNDNIIKYTPEQIDPRHQKVMEILMSKLKTEDEDNSEEDNQTDEQTEEVINDEE